MISGKYCSLSNYYNNVQPKRLFCCCYYLDNVQSHSPAILFVYSVGLYQYHTTKSWAPRRQVT